MEATQRKHRVLFDAEQWQMLERHARRLRMPTSILVRMLLEERLRQWDLADSDPLEQRFSPAATESVK
jgi:hypothetical protein